MGEIAALLTSLCWAVTTIQFTLAIRRVGPAVVNRTRLALAVLLLSLTHLLVYGRAWPGDASLSQLGWLGLSGALGLVVADGSLLQALLLIGPRLATVLAETMVPVFCTLVAWIWLGERLQWAQVAAVLLTVSGVAWVVAERKQDQAQEARMGSRKQYALGVLLSVVSALGQALGLVMTKPVLSAGVPSLSATLIRMVIAMVAMWLYALIGRQAGATVRALRDRRAFWLIASGAVVGPFLGVWLSLFAVQHAQVGIASTLMGLSPILIIPLARVFFREKVSLRGVAGTVIALVGATVIVLT